MFRKIISNLPFSPSVSEEITHLFTSLRKKSSILIYVLVLSLLMLIIQSGEYFYNLTGSYTNKKTNYVSLSSQNSVCKNNQTNCMHYSIKMSDLTRPHRDSTSLPKAFLGDTLQYTLTTTNTGAKTAQNVELIDDITHLSSYVDIIDVSNGTFDHNQAKTITWQVGNIKPGHTISRTILVKVKSSYAALTQNSSVPLNFSLINTFGNTTQILLKKSWTQNFMDQITNNSINEATKPALFISLIFTLLASYFYLDNKQKQKELLIIKNEFEANRKT